MSDDEKQQQTSGTSQTPSDKSDRELYMEHAKQAWQDIQTSTDQFDRSLLTLSSGALGLSIAFIKDLVPLKDAVGLCWLEWSWLSFALCIVITVASFRFSVAAQNKHLDYLKEYYLGRRNEFLNMKSCWLIALDWCSLLGGVSFLSGVVCTLVFAFQNIGRIHS